MLTHGPLLVVGATGNLGGELCRQADAAGRPVVGTGFASAAAGHRLDLRDRSATLALVQRVRPAAIVNAAAVCDDWRLCADGAAHLALAARAVGARFVHVSSDALHRGRPEPYADDEPPSPVHAYGAAKAAAETAVRAIDPGAAIVRTSLILGDEHSRQVKLCLDLITGRRPGALFADEVRCPVAVEDLAAAVLELVGSSYAGLLNVTGPEAVSRPELGRLVAARYGVDASGMPVGTIAEAGLVRPAEVRLDVARAGGLLHTRLRPVSEALAPR